MIARPEGIIMVTGPTGSGKTTTLYSILNHINSDGVNIMTLEDPVEYPMTLIRQTSVAEAAKLDFANGIRAMMRQDPDVILVGEMRDEDTAEMAFRAAMTGHQVYTTLHTNSAVGAIPRLLDIGIVPDIMAGNIIGIIAQRLVRKLCRTCRQSYDPDVKERRLLGLSPTEPAALFRSVGCEQCDYQGYRGRVGIMEILKMDSAIDELVARRATAREILTAARAKGFMTLAEDGIRLVRARRHQRRRADARRRPDRPHGLSGLRRRPPRSRARQVFRTWLCTRTRRSTHRARPCSGASTRATSSTWSSASRAWGSTWSAARRARRRAA